MAPPLSCAPESKQITSKKFSWILIQPKEIAILQMHTYVCIHNAYVNDVFFTSHQFYLHHKVRNDSVEDGAPVTICP